MLFMVIITGQKERDGGICFWRRRKWEPSNATDSGGLELFVYGVKPLPCYVGVSSFFFGVKIRG